MIDDGLNIINTQSVNMLVNPDRLAEIVNRKLSMFESNLPDALQGQFTATELAALLIYYDYRDEVKPDEKPCTELSEKMKCFIAQLHWLSDNEKRELLDKFNESYNFHKGSITYEQMCFVILAMRRILGNPDILESISATGDKYDSYIHLVDGIGLSGNNPVFDMFKALFGIDKSTVIRVGISALIDFYKQLDSDIDYLYTRYGFAELLNMYMSAIHKKINWCIIDPRLVPMWLDNDVNHWISEAVRELVQCYGGNWKKGFLTRLGHNCEGIHSRDKVDDELAARVWEFCGKSTIGIEWENVGRGMAHYRMSELTRFYASLGWDVHDVFKEGSYEVALLFYSWCVRNGYAYRKIIQGEYVMRSYK